MNIRRGLTVIVTAGKDKGKRGQIERVLAARQQVIVGGLNMMKRHVKPSQKYPSGGIVEIAAPIHQSNIMITEEEAEKPKQPTKKST